MDIPRFSEWKDLALIDYLALLFPDRSRRALGSLFALGRLRSGGKPVGARLRLGEVRDLTLIGSLEDIERIPTGSGEGEGLAPEIIYEDERLVVLAKPSGLPVVPDRTRSSGSCLGFLIWRELEARRRKHPAEYLRYRIVHRIDGLTSGLVLVAKTPEAERLLGVIFERHEVLKEYLALLGGCVLPARFTVNCPVVPGRKGKMRAAGSRDAGGTQLGGAALTEFDVLARWHHVTLVRARPRTGRTHQIRVHAWAAGHPLAVDPVYAKAPGPRRCDEMRGLCGLHRLTLHAYRYSLPEAWEAPRVFTCPLPEDFRRALADLGYSMDP